MNIPTANLLCFSHLRWNFVYQRPQHLLSRFSKTHTVYFFEEPVIGGESLSRLELSKQSAGLWIIVPYLPAGLSKERINEELKQLLDSFLQNRNLEDFTFWYYTPMALEYSAHLQPKLLVYDCMDELSAFKFAPEKIRMLEKKLLQKADLVFTGGQSLYEAKRHQHENIYPFPSSIEKIHFAKARLKRSEPSGQAAIPGPKLGFFGVIDERFDIELIRKIAEARPGWQIILIGPVVKIDPSSLPGNANIHYLGQKSYTELPDYLSGWDIALIPFLLNESTRFISPTKTPEYLAAGIRVVSTAIRDVVNPYGARKLVKIGYHADEFIAAIQTELDKKDQKKWLARTDRFLAGNSWDVTFSSMQQLMKETILAKAKIAIAS